MRMLKQAVTNSRQIRIITKLFIGYILLICIPFVIFGYFFYKQMYDNMLDQYRVGKEQIMTQSYSNLEIELSKLESIYQLFQNNVKLTDFLNGAYTYDWEIVYNYRKEIIPTFAFATFTNPNVRDIHIYKLKPEVPEIPPDILDIQTFQSPNNEDTPLFPLSSKLGFWTFKFQGSDKLPIMAYTHKLFTENYIRELGLLHVTANEELFTQFFRTLQSGDQGWNSIVDGRNKFIFSESVPGWSQEQLSKVAESLPKTGVKSFYIQSNRYLVSSVSVDKWQLTIMVINKVGPVFKLSGKTAWSIAAGLLLLVLLSLFYFMIASSITRRIIRFSRYLKRVEGPQLSVYQEQSGNDEIGFLISSYNAMITRVDELVSTVHRAELLKAEAELKMLQAQIKPHFIYNTLETIRMLALVKGDDSIAEISFMLGKLLRYSLARGKDETILSEEVENVRCYIAIHKLRMGSRLTFEIEVDNTALHFPCPRFILQPLVENSILHGIEKKRGPGKIKLQISNHPDAVKICLSDNGIGIPEEKLEAIREVLAGVRMQEQSANSGGIGLSNVNERIRSFFGGRSGMTIDSEWHGGTKFEICLDKNGRRRQHVEIDDRG
jgi:two-component system sensor histidine kinase YesM